MVRCNGCNSPQVVMQCPLSPFYVRPSLMEVSVDHVDPLDGSQNLTFSGRGSRAYSPPAGRRSIVWRNVGPMDARVGFCITIRYTPRFTVGDFNPETTARVVICGLCRRLLQHPLTALPSKLPSSCSHLLAMSYVNQPPVSLYPDLTSHSPVARPLHRWIYFPVLQPKQRRRLLSPPSEDKSVRLESVVADVTQARWIGCNFRRQNRPRRPILHTVHAGSQWSSALVT